MLLRKQFLKVKLKTVSYTHLRAHETDSYLVCRLLLEKMLLDEREAQFSNRIKHKTGQLNESHLLRESKTKIAQIKTVINEKNNEETKS